MTLLLNRDGAELVRGAAGQSLEQLRQVLEVQLADRAGLRLTGVPGLAELLNPGGEIGNITVERLGDRARSVRAILFDKSAATNWQLGWHQDRAIAVKDRRDVPGFEPWTVKAGIPHVAPPVALLERMLTIRIHFDPIDADNAPLLIAPGSHRLGLVPEGEMAAAVRRCGTHACLAAEGDVWVYATLILHASEAARDPRHRRVLQVDYSAEALPGALEWAGL